MRRLLRYTFYIIITITVILLLFLEVITLLDYKPKPQTILTEDTASVLDKDTITIISWNIGYAGLGADMDFFYDGGRKMRTSKNKTQVNLDSICSFLNQKDSLDIILIQEIDKKAHRSYNINQLNYVSKKLSQYVFYYAKDYDVIYVPLPVFNPMMNVESGIATLTRYLPNQCIQYAYPSQGKWPVNLFLLDNCFILSRYLLKNGSYLIIINTHNSAYDDGSKRMVEMDYLKQIILDEYNKGNYVVVGGDWNQMPPLLQKDIKYDDKKYLNHKQNFTPLAISAEFMPSGWEWISDGKATNRFLYEAYERGKTAETLLDFFLISPNVECIYKETFDLGFQHSDHNPILLKFVLKKIIY